MTLTIDTENIYLGKAVPGEGGGGGTVDAYTRKETDNLLVDKLNTNANNFTEDGIQMIKDIVSDDFATKEEVTDLAEQLDGKQDLLTASDGIKIQDVTVGAYPYTSTYQALVDAGQNLNLTSKINITNKHIDFLSENTYAVFNFKFLGTTSSPYGCALCLSLGYKAGNERMNGYYLSLNGNGYIKGAFYNQSDYIYPQKSLSSLGITPGTNVRIELIYKRADNSYRTIITNTTTSKVLDDYTVVNTGNPGLTGGAFTYPEVYGGLNVNNYVRIPASGIYLAENKDLRIEHQISANIDNDTILFDNGKLKANLAPLEEKLAEIEAARFVNATVIGEPNILQGQVSGFSTMNYLIFPTISDFHDQAFEFEFAFTPSDNVQVQQNILDSRFGLALAIKDGKGLMAISSDGQSWNLGQATGTFNIQSNVTHYAKVSWNKLQYKTAISTTEGVYTDDMTITAATPPFPTAMYIGGCNVTETGHDPHPFLGSINMNKAKFRINGQLVWQGMDDVGLDTRLDLSLSNVNAAGIQKIKDIAGGSTGGGFNPETKNIGDGLALSEKSDTIKTDLVIPETGVPYSTSALSKTISGYYTGGASCASWRYTVYPFYGQTFKVNSDFVYKVCFGGNDASRTQDPGLDNSTRVYPYGNTNLYVAFINSGTYPSGGTRFKVVVYYRGAVLRDLGSVELHSGSKNFITVSYSAEENKLHIRGRGYTWNTAYDESLYDADSTLSCDLDVDLSSTVFTQGDIATPALVLGAIMGGYLWSPAQTSIGYMLEPDPTTTYKIVSFNANNLSEAEKESLRNVIGIGAIDSALDEINGEVI